MDFGADGASKAIVRMTLISGKAHLLDGTWRMEPGWQLTEQEAIEIACPPWRRASR